MGVRNGFGSACRRRNARGFRGRFWKGRGAVGPLWFAQEYMGEFVDSGAAVFGRDLVDRAVDDGFQALDI